MGGLFRSAILLAAWAILAAPDHGLCADAEHAQAEFFEQQIRPILAEHCFACHSQAAGKNKGGLFLDSKQGLAEGGDSGSPVIAGDPDTSRLIEAVRYQNAEFKMPPKGKLADAQIEALVRWVKQGAVWPKADGLSNRRVPGKITDADRQWWAFRPMQETRPPREGQGWARNDIDRFVAAKLKAAGLQPAPEASRIALVRRLTFDLLGLPPTPEEIAAFLRDSETAPDLAYEKLLDRLLASPRYGERWARHWLDLVRYADSDGYRLDEYRPNAWRYRDYVIRSLNNDKPYDRFVREQLAGDELYPGDNDALVATGYLRHWIYEYNARDVRGQWTVILNDITDTTADVFFGLGLQCARCHDHKFDPILQKDYFRLQAFFANLRPRDDIVLSSPQELADHAARLKVWETKTAAIRADLAALEQPYRGRAMEVATIKFPADIMTMLRKPAAQRTPLEAQLAELAYRQVDYELDHLERSIKGADKERRLALLRQLAEFDAIKPAPPAIALAATDVGPSAPPTTIPKKPGGPIEPGFPTILREQPAAIVRPPTAPASSGRRATLALWLTERDNPLTARVIVNRVWQQHFGHGLAANASDFGRLGEPPTHPELLDWLATQFVREGWSLKKLHRLIVTSSTYRQSAVLDEKALKAAQLVDPENRLLGRGLVRRLDAEQIRDAVFAVTGELELTPGGPGAVPTLPRRSIFTNVIRNNRDPFLDVFDTPLGINSAASRHTTTTPVQSLLLINGQTLIQRSRAFRDRLLREVPEDEAARIDRAYRLALGRSPSTEEAAAARKFIGDQEVRIDAKKSVSAAATFVAGKIPFRDGQAAEMKLGAACFQVPHADCLPEHDFTIEAFVLPRSVADTGAVRTVAAKCAASLKEPGWLFGVTGKKSRRKPQTVVMQMVGKKANGEFGEEAVFADLHVALNKPYYLAAAVKLATDKIPGRVTFYLKDLSNDDEPLLIAKVEHSIVGSMTNKAPLTLGGRGTAASFDGLLDDVRLSDSALGVDQLLFTHEGVNRHTIGYWQFEAKPNVYRDGSGHGLDIRTDDPAVTTAKRDVHRTAWADFCHVLLNASEFLYVE
jgi:mono/diheme cytochrome c family protein